MEFDYNFETDFEFDFNFETDTESDFDQDHFSSQDWFENVKKSRKFSRINFLNASKMAKGLPDFEEDGDRLYSFVSGSFIFGDLIEAMLVEKKWLSEEVTISTLSMNQENIDSLFNLIEWGLVYKVNILISRLWFINERGRGMLVPYFYKKFANYLDRVQLSVNSAHTKICIFRTECGKHMTIHGSSNLRSSNSVEQCCIENNKDLYEFNKKYLDLILEDYKTINKPVTGQKIKQLLGVWKKGRKNG